MIYHRFGPRSAIARKCCRKKAPPMESGNEFPHSKWACVLLVVLVTTSGLAQVPDPGKIRRRNAHAGGPTRHRPGLAVARRPAERRRQFRRRRPAGQRGDLRPLAAWPSWPAAARPAAAPTATACSGPSITSWPTPSPAASSANRVPTTQGPMYSHGFATLFLAECCGMSPRADLRDKLGRAVKLIVNYAEQGRRLALLSEDRGDGRHLRDRPAR